MLGDGRYTFSLQAIVQELLKFVSVLDTVYVYTINFDGSMLPISLLDILEVIFGVGVVASIIYSMTGFSNSIENK